MDGPHRQLLLGLGGPGCGQHLLAGGDHVVHVAAVLLSGGDELVLGAVGLPAAVAADLLLHAGSSRWTSVPDITLGGLASGWQEGGCAVRVSLTGPLCLESGERL